MACPRSRTLSAIQTEYGRVVYAAETEEVFVQTLKRQKRRMRIMMKNRLVVLITKSNCFGLAFLSQGMQVVNNNIRSPIVALIRPP